MKAAGYIILGHAKQSSQWQIMHQVVGERSLYLGPGTLFASYNSARNAMRRSQRADRKNPAWAGWLYRIRPLCREGACP